MHVVVMMEWGFKNRNLEPNSGKTNPGKPGSGKTNPGKPGSGKTNPGKPGSGKPDSELQGSKPSSELRAPNTNLPLKTRANLFFYGHLGAQHGLLLLGLRVDSS